MRKTVLIAACALLVSAALKAQKDKSETIEGNGKVVTKEIPVSSFEILKASGVYDLKLSQGAGESVKIEADENLHQYFNVRNEGNALVIDMNGTKNRSMKLKSKLKVFVTFKTIKEMDLSMVGDVMTDTPLQFADLKIDNNSVGKVELALSATTLQLKNNSVGKVKLSGKAENAVVAHNSVGHLEAGNFVVQTMNIDNAGIGGAEVNAARQLTVSDNMLGKVKNRGAAPVKRNKRIDI